MPIKKTPPGYGSLGKAIGKSMDLPEFGQDSNMRIIDDKLMMAAMKVAIGQELTQRQMECLAMYFGERLTLKEIGLRLGIGKSTVYKHIETGKAKIRQVLMYALAFKRAMEEDDG